MEKDIYSNNKNETCGTSNGTTSSSYCQLHSFRLLLALMMVMVMAVNFSPSEQLTHSEQHLVNS